MWGGLPESCYYISKGQHSWLNFSHFSSRSRPYLLIIRRLFSHWQFLSHLVWTMTTKKFLVQGFPLWDKILCKFLASPIPKDIIQGHIFIYIYVLVFLGFHDKIQQIGYLKRNMFIFLQFWTLEVQDPGAKVGFWRRFSPWFANSHPLTVLSHGHFLKPIYHFK